VPETVGVERGAGECAIFSRSGGTGWRGGLYPYHDEQSSQTWEEGKTQSIQPVKKMWSRKEGERLDLGT